MRWFVGTNSGISEEAFLIMAAFFGVLAFGALVSAIVDSLKAGAASIQPGQGRQFVRFIFRSAQFFGGIFAAVWAANAVVSIDAPFTPALVLVLSVAIAVSMRAVSLVFGLGERAPMVAVGITLSILLSFFSWAPFAIVSALEAPVWSYWITLVASGLASYGALAVIRELQRKQSRSTPNHMRRLDFTEQLPLKSIGFFLLGGGTAGQFALDSILASLGVSGAWHFILFWTAALINVALACLGLLLLITGRSDLVSPRVAKQIAELEKNRSSLEWIRFTDANRYQESAFYFDFVVEKRKTFFTMRIEPKFIREGLLETARSLNLKTTDTNGTLSVEVPWNLLKEADALTGLIRMVVPKRTDLYVLAGYTPKATRSQVFFFPPSLLEEEWEYESPKQRRLRAKQSKSVEPSFGRAVPSRGPAVAGGVAGYSVTTVAWKETREVNDDASGESYYFDL